MTEEMSNQSGGDFDPKAPAPGKSDRGVILISYPKIVFLYPSWIVSIIAALVLYFGPGSAAAVNVTWIFLIVLMTNLIVLSFDFPRATSLLLFAIVLALVLGGALLVVYFPGILPTVSAIILSLKPEANVTFFTIFASVITLIYVAAFFTSRLDYWEVRPNELLHHHGVLSDLERFSSPSLRLDKEINDIFEYLLLGSGRLILHPSNERRAIVLDNVFFISQKEKAITKLLGALQVQVREQSR